jgi:hypothetical protein
MATVHSFAYLPVLLPVLSIVALSQGIALWDSTRWSLAGIVLEDISVLEDVSVLEKMATVHSFMNLWVLLPVRC